MSGLNWQMFFDGWASVIRTIIVGSLAYVLLVILLRFSGKRTLSKMNAFDMVITVAFGSTLASILISEKVSLAQGVVALMLLVVLQFVNAWLAVRYPKYQAIIKAKPTLLLYQGRFLESALREQRVSREEIIAAIRMNGASDPSQVDAVIIETNGTFSVLLEVDRSRQALDSLGIDLDAEAYQQLTDKLQSSETTAPAGLQRDS